MQEEVKDILLIKYITGEALPDECELITNWIAEKQENELYFVELKSAWHQLQFNDDFDSLDVDKAYRLLVQKKSIPARSVIPDFLQKFKVAAVIISFLSVAALLYFIIGTKKESKTAFSQQIIVPKGDKKKILLNDGTVVWLNSASVLHVDNDFGKKNRNVYLEGEGYFEVVHKEDMVFTITTKNYTIRDIGTSFNVISYPSESIFETAVIDGKVSVEGRFKENKLSTIYLSKNGVLKVKNSFPEISRKELAENRLPQVVVKNSPAIENYIVWKDDMLVFDDDIFSDIALKLERKYNVVIVIKGETLGNYHYSGSFNKVGSIDKVLDIIKETTPISYKINADTVTIQHK